MAYENMVFAVSPITSTIYMFHQPKTPGIMPEARRDVTNQFINGVIDRCKQSGYHVMENGREMLMYSDNQDEMAELMKVHEKYAEVRDE